MMDEDNVRVALRIRPQIPSEIIEQCRICISVTPEEPQVFLGQDKSFTYDYVFQTTSRQEEIFTTCVRDLINGCLEGYNATILAYGQTGSGKTFTMGTGFEVGVEEEHIGIIPRALRYLFSSIDENIKSKKEAGEPPPEFKVSAQFLELYNEEMFDLLDLAQNANRGKKKGISIHNDKDGGVVADGASSRTVTSVEDAMDCLHTGALSRTTASTAMNVQSSRSHAIFTLIIKQQRVVKNEMAEDEEQAETQDEPVSEFETLKAKFHFVDLAGSERLKRTGATGDRAKEGISINCGLLSLGNVISALGKVNRTHVPYRDSKLTRLLQDSLGGNSRTIMIACVSPSDRDFMETLNTLKYANRAREIKNKVTINQDVSSKTITKLRQEINRLELELSEYKQGKRVCSNGKEYVNDMFHENTMLQADNDTLRARIKALQETVDGLTARNVALQQEKDLGRWITNGEVNVEMSEVVERYVKEIELLKTRLMETENMYNQQVKRNSIRSSTSRLSPSAIEAEVTSTSQFIDSAKRGIMIESYLIRKKSGASESQDFDPSVNGRKDDVDNEEDDQDSSSSVSEAEEEDNPSNPELNDLEKQICSKQKLIEELEKNQALLGEMKRQYEEKLSLMKENIKKTEEERDKVMASSTLGKVDDKGNKMKDEEEKKYAEAKKQLKRLQVDLQGLKRKKTEADSHLASLRNEVQTMKRTKVQLMKKLKEEVAKHKEVERQSKREMSQLRKAYLKGESKISKLETESRNREVVLRRKQEELMHFKHMAKPNMSDAAAGRFRNASRRVASSPKVQKSLWANVEKNISKLALMKQTQLTAEREMERSLKERNALNQQLFEVEGKYKSVKRRTLFEGSENLPEMEEEMENLRCLINYHNDTIMECQQKISQVDTEDSGDAQQLEELLQMSKDRDKDYLLSKLLHMTISMCTSAAQKSADIEELGLRIAALEKDTGVKAELLEHLMKKGDLNLSSLYSELESAGAVAEEGDSNSESSSRASSPSSTFRVEGGGGLIKDKARKKTATTEDLLYNRERGLMNTTVTISSSREDNALCTNPTDSNNVPQRGALNRVPSVPTTLKNLVNNNNILTQVTSNPYVTSPSLRRRQIIAVSQSAKLDRRNPYNSMPVLTTARQLSNTSGGDASPPGSPTAPRRNRDKGVFVRLTVGTSTNSEVRPNRGIIKEKPQRNTRSPLILTDMAEGHSHSVLSLDATDNLLFSASNDKTVKIWDLNAGVETHSLDGHPSTVHKVRYDMANRLVYSVSLSYIRVWDIRQKSPCIKTLTSQGASVAPQSVPHTETVSTTGDPSVCDICLRENSVSLYAAVQERVIILDLRKTGILCKIQGGHSAAVMCMVLETQDSGVDRLVTGSKDHTVKVYNVSHPTPSVLGSDMNLEPPHYDGVESLALSGNILYSGSRDTCLKKWDLGKGELKMTINQSHKNWVTCLRCLPDKKTLLSGCRSGVVKIWNLSSGKEMGVARVHSNQVNDIATNSTRIFTASNSGEIGIWRVRADPMTCSLDSLYGL